MVRTAACLALVLAIGIVAHRVYQTWPQQKPNHLEQMYGEKWIIYDEDRMVYAGLKYDPSTQQFEVTNIYTPPVSIRNRIGAQ